MPKPIPVIEAEGRQTEMETVELRLTAIDGKKVTLAFMPSFVHNLIELLDRLQRAPETTMIVSLPGHLRKVMRDIQLGEPRKSGGFRLATDLSNRILFLSVSQSNGETAEIPLDEELARRLIDRLAGGLEMIRPGDGTTH